MQEPPNRGWLSALASGALPLPEAFWWYGIVYGLVVNAVATLIALGVAAAHGPGWLVVGLYLAPLPYNLLVLVAVWRSAGRWRGEPRWAALARLAVVLWVVLLTAA